MAVFDNFHSRLVFWLKILLPLAALAILSTLFLVSRRIDFDAAIPYAEVDVDALVRDQRVTAPEFAGLTEDGARVTVTARVARPAQDESGGASAEGLNALYQAPGGLNVGMTSSAGILDPQAGRLTLTGGAAFEASSGYTVQAQGFDARLDRTEVTSAGAVDVTAPFGQLQAGGMSLTRAPAADAGYLLVFNGGVQLLYDPQP